MGRDLAAIDTSPTLEDVASLASAGNTVVLVVEDDERLLAVIGRMLARHHCVALPARGEAEARTVLEAQGAYVDLILCDVVLAGPSGPQVMAALCAHAPRAQVLYMSGHSREDLLADGTLAIDAPFIQKPFAPRELAERVHEALHG